MQTADGHNSRPNLEAIGADADGANGRNGASVILAGPFRDCGLRCGIALLLSRKAKWFLGALSSNTIWAKKKCAGSRPYI